MSRFFWILLLILWILFGMWVCKRYICGNGLVAAPSKTTIINNNDGWSIKDGSNLSYLANQGLRFKQNTSNRLATNQSVNAGIDRTAEYLKANNNRALTITGYYKDSETNNSAFPNLGIARANDIKTWLQRQGVAGNQIELAGQVMNVDRWRNDTIYSGIDFAFAGMAADNDRLDVIKKRLFGKPITLYFQTNSNSLALTAQQRQDFADLNYYMDRVNNARLDVSGHTDNVGNLQANINLSKERAEFVKNYLQSRAGITLNRMDVNGYGPNKPVATNNTSNGKQKNRRVEVVLK